jgi:hypothetical protein
MAVFIHPRALENAAPVCLRLEWPGALPAAPPRPVASWAIDSDGRLARRWRLIAWPAP